MSLKRFVGDTDDLILDDTDTDDTDDDECDPDDPDSDCDNSDEPTDNSFNPQQERDDHGRWASQVASISTQLDAGNQALSRTRGASSEGLSQAAPKQLSGMSKDSTEKQAMLNAGQTAKLVHSYATGPNPNTPQDVKQMMLHLASAVNDGIVPDNKGPFREWDTQTSPMSFKDVPKNFDKLSADIYNRWKEVTTDPVGLAAFAEWNLNAGPLHPFYDGCGRTSRAVSAVILQRGGFDLPQYTNSKDYFEHARNEGDFEKYLRGITSKTTDLKMGGKL